MTGTLTISDVRPAIVIEPGANFGSVSADVDAELSASMLETSTGASLWGNSAALTERVAQISVLGGKNSHNVRGTGCFLASSILAYLDDGRPLKEACGLGIFRVGRAMRAAVPAGQGTWVFDLNRERGRVPLPPVA